MPLAVLATPDLKPLSNTAGFLGSMLGKKPAWAMP